MLGRQFPTELETIINETFKFQDLFEPMRVSKAPIWHISGFVSPFRYA